MHFREPIDYSDPSASGTLVAVGQGLNDAHPDCEPEWVCSGEHLSASLSVCDCRARKLLTESIFYHMRGGQGEVFVIRRADYFGLTVACILSSLRTIYRTAANEGSSTGLPFCPVFSHSCRARVEICERPLAQVARGLLLVRVHLILQSSIFNLM
jgi:hypothetical protein